MTTENDEASSNNDIVLLGEEDYTHPTVGWVSECWEDECQYAETHQATRKQLLTGCTLLTGAIFLILDSMMDHADSITTGTALYISASLGLICVFMVFLTLYKLYTNRSVFRIHLLLVFWAIWHKGDVAKRPDHVPRGRAARKMLQGDTIEQQIGDVSELLGMNPNAAEVVQCLRQVGAYHELQRKNDVIKERNNSATNLFLLSVLVGLTSLVCYVFAVHNEGLKNTSSQPQSSTLDIQNSQEKESHNE